MNVFTNSAYTTTSGDSNAVIYTSPAATASIVHSIYVDSVANGTFTLSLNATTPFASAISVISGAPVVFDKPINLNSGDSIDVTTSTTGINILISVLQIS